ncbi:MAG: helix-turn-helix domain-containing protein [Nitrososphaeraceae archaeon]|jgi:DNA-binding HxlR family transcriptional regulator
METKGKERVRQSNARTKLPVIDDLGNCDFHGYNADTLMKETAKLRKIITKRGTLEILIPLCCTTTPVRYFKFRNTLKGFSSKTLAKRLKELDKSGILERQAYNEIPPRVEYRLTNKGQQLVESVIYLLNWMRKWAKD